MNSSMAVKTRGPLHKFGIFLPRWGQTKLMGFALNSASPRKNVDPNENSPVKTSELENLSEKLRDSMEEKEAARARPRNLRSGRTELSYQSARGNFGDGENQQRPTKRRKLTFSVGMSKQEVEEDFKKTLGRMPRSRPKTRPAKVQKILDKLFPGMLLTEISEDAYKMPPKKQ